MVIVDEMAQLSTAQLAGLFRQADRSGAILRGAGDYRQFASIERGGLFEVLCDEHEAAKLTAIYRVKDADQKSLVEIARAIRDVSDRARNGQLSRADVSSGTFTISNMGMLGVESFTPIIIFCFAVSGS